MARYGRMDVYESDGVCIYADTAVYAHFHVLRTFLSFRTFLFSPPSASS